MDRTRRSPAQRITIEGAIVLASTVGVVLVVLFGSLLPLAVGCAAGLIVGTQEFTTRIHPAAGRVILVVGIVMLIAGSTTGLRGSLASASDDLLTRTESELTTERTALRARAAMGGAPITEPEHRRSPVLFAAANWRWRSLTHHPSALLYWASAAFLATWGAIGVLIWTGYPGRRVPEPVMPGHAPRK